MLSRRGLQPEAFISPGDSSDETVVFICATGRLHVRSAAALPLVSEASLAAPAPGRPRTNGQPTLCDVVTSLATPLATGAEGGGSRRAMVAVRAVHDGPAHPHMRLRG